MDCTYTTFTESAYSLDVNQQMRKSELEDL